MTRRSPSRIAAGLALALVAAGCGQALSDPVDIVSRARTAMQSVNTFHFEADAEGQMVVGVEDTSPSPSAPAAASASAATASPSASAAQSASAPSSAAPSPSGPASTSIPLGGTIVIGAVNLADGTAQMTGKVPGLPNLNGDVIIDLDQAYIRAAGEPQFHAVATDSLPFNPADAAGLHGLVDAILTLAGDPNLKPSLVGVEQCQEGDCYHIKVTISADEANKSFNGGGALAVGAGQLDVWILKGGYRVARAEFLSSDPHAGNFWGRVLFTRYDEAVNIAAPAPDQVAP